MSDDYPLPESADAPYPAVRLIRRHGNWLALGIGILPLLAGLWASLALGSVAWLVGGVATGVVVGFLMRSYVELVRIIADMLLPR
ncbi:MAG: hypothetical protein AB7O80_07645 [Acetobacteraceae bacterium]